MSSIETWFLSKADMKRAKKFADEREAADTSLYARRGGFKKVDIVSGAMAELAVYRVLKEYDVEISFPDFKIYETRDKSYSSDLTDGLHHFHVKGQTLESKQRYGPSWLMQKSDPLINNPQRLNYLVPCTVCTETGRVEIYGIFSILSLIQNNCVGECKVPWFNKTKVAFYLDHIEPIFTQKARWGFLRKFKERVERHRQEVESELRNT